MATAITVIYGSLLLLFFAGCASVLYGKLEKYL